MSADGPRTTRDDERLPWRESPFAGRREDTAESVVFPAARFINGRFLAIEEREVPFAVDWRG